MGVRFPPPALAATGSAALAYSSVHGPAARGALESLPCGTEVRCGNPLRAGADERPGRPRCVASTVREQVEAAEPASEEHVAGVARCDRKSDAHGLRNALVDEADQIGDVSLPSDAFEARRRPIAGASG